MEYIVLLYRVAANRWQVNMSSLTPEFSTFIVVTKTIDGQQPFVKYLVMKPIMRDILDYTTFSKMIMEISWLHKSLFYTQVSFKHNILLILMHGYVRLWYDLGSLEMKQFHRGNVGSCTHLWIQNKHIEAT